MPPGRPRGSHEIANKVRRAFEQAVENLKRGGTITDLSDIWQNMIIQDPFRAFEVLAKFMPKEMMVEQDTTHRIISGEPVSAEEWERTYLAGAPVEIDDDDDGGLH